VTTVEADAGLRRSFAVGVVLVVLAMVAAGALIRAANAGHHRPEGVAEHWLAAISETTRRGVTADATRRAETLGPVSIAARAGLLPDVAGGKAAFDDLEVGKATAARDGARVPFLLHERVPVHGGVTKSGAVVLSPSSSPAGWRVVAIDPRRSPSERVPSEGGPPPSRAPTSLWLFALAGSVLLTAACVGLMEMASRGTR
jgi:hypothetical protein